MKASHLVFGLIALISTRAGAGPLDDAKAAYDKRDFATAIRLWLPLAEAGDAEAQDRVALLFQKGEGVPKDDAKAVAWFSKAAEQGNADAEGNLGALYFLGSGGLPKNAPLAVSWMRKSAEHGNVTMQDGVGSYYSAASLMGGTTDPAQAIYWWSKAAENGYAPSMRRLGLAYTAGQLVPKDEAVAMSWFRKAAEKGDAAAQVSLGVAYAQGAGVPKDSSQALAWLQKAAQQGGALQAMAENYIAQIKGDATAGSGQKLDEVKRQVYPYWNIDLGKRNALALTVQIHVVLADDGTVVGADIVDLVKYQADADFHKAADGARNAVLRKNKIISPAGGADIPRDFVLTFDPRDVVK